MRVPVGSCVEGVVSMAVRRGVGVGVREIVGVVGMGVVGGGEGGGGGGGGRHFAHG